MSNGNPELSFIVEWDNTRYYAIQRARRMLHRLVRQVKTITRRAEILLLFDEMETASAHVEAAADDVARQAAGAVDVRTIPVRGLRYYQLKNHGAKHARGSMLVFIDSDVLPEDGWLTHLLASLDDSSVDLVIGGTYVQTDTLYSKIFALGWYYPERTAQDSLTTTTSLWVNNLAVRRATFEKHPFPESRELYIQQTPDYAEQLQAAGVIIYLNQQARVAHPPPRFWRSALIAGHDGAIRSLRTVDRRVAFRHAYWSLRGDLGRAWSRIVNRRATVGLPTAWMPVALVVITMFYALQFLAQTATLVTPRIVRCVYRI